jgi:uncharacterized protein YndB with AHSA1/START domain
MSAETVIPADQPTIVMTRVFDAPRALVWRAMTEAEHVRLWWGGPGVANPVCEMDVRPGGRWKHVMRFPDGHELRLDFVFLEVEAPARLVWRHAERDSQTGGPPAAHTTVTLDEQGEDARRQTRWTMVARFGSMAEREAALAIGFTGPIAASSDQLIAYLPTLREEQRHA